MMVKAWERGWEMHYVNECPYKDRSTCMYNCVYRFVLV